MLIVLQVLLVLRRGGIASLAADSSPQLGGFLDAAGNYIQMEKGGDIASASPTVIDTDGDFFAVTGTTNFSAFTVAADRHFFLEFGAVLTMTHGNGTLDLPGGANITTAASDVGEFVSTAANVVTCVNYTKRDGTAVALADNSITLAKMAGNTDGVIITFDASGDPVAVGPGSDGEVLTSTGAGSPPAFEEAAGGGKLLQVVQTQITATSTQSVSASTVANISDLNVAITPASSSNKILVKVRWIGDGAIAGINDGMWGIKRDTTAIGNPSAAGSRIVGIAGISLGQVAHADTTSMDSSTYEYLDSPSSTSEITYYATYNFMNAQTIYNNRSRADTDASYGQRGTSTITVMEISA